MSNSQKNTGHHQLSMELFLDDLKTLSSNAIPISKQTKILLYGAGNFGRKVCRTLISQGYTISGFIDQKAAPGQTINNIPVYLPEREALFSLKKEDFMVLITVHNREVDLLSINAILQKLGFSKVMNPVEFYNFAPTEFGNQFWLTSPSAYQKWKEEIIATFSLWEDDSSRALYLALLHQRITGDYSVLPSPDKERQYFPLTTPPWKYPLKLVDCGAYDGDSLLQMKLKDIAVSTVAAFEPDIQNFNKLSNYIQTEWHSPALLFPCGVYSFTGQLRFASDGGESAKLSETGDSMIQVVALDAVLHQFHPNLIKMDIEGAEIDGLLGAKKIIQQDRPGLAICVYHYPQHLWKIPEMINQWDLKYKFYLRAHAHNGFDVVMYAVQS